MQFSSNGTLEDNSNGLAEDNSLSWVAVYRKPIFSFHY